MKNKRIFFIATLSIIIGLVTIPILIKQQNNSGTNNTIDNLKKSKTPITIYSNNISDLISANYLSKNNNLQLKMLCNIKQRKYFSFSDSKTTLKPSEQSRLKEKFEQLQQGSWSYAGTTIDMTDFSSFTNKDLSRDMLYRLNAWHMIDQTLQYYDLSGDQNVLAYVKNFVLTYTKGRYFDNNDYRTENNQDFTWYDMSVGLRAGQLGFIVNELFCKNKLSESEAITLLNFAQDHVLYLAADKYYVNHNNHGIYQANGAIALCRRAPYLKNCQALLDISEQRLDILLNQSFIQNFHTEHSPAYMNYMLWILYEIEKNPDYYSHSFYKKRVKQLNDIEYNLQWFIKPNHYFVMFGDTDRKKPDIEQFNINQSLGADNIKWLLSNGAQGKRPDQSSHIANDAGYAFFRYLPQDLSSPKLASYLAVAAAFHSRTHKHSDDANLVWSDKGSEILIDAGRYQYEGRNKLGSPLSDLGFWYSDPKRMFVESTRAHNSVEIDDTTSSRKKNPLNNKKIKPYGSGIRGGADNTQGVFATQVIIERPEQVEQQRIVILDAGSRLIVIDTIKDLSDTPHKYTQWFNFAPTLKIETKTKDTATISDKNISLSLKSYANTTLNHYRGQTEPRLQGWHAYSSQDFSPNLSIGLSQSGKNVQFITALTIAPTISADRISIMTDTQASSQSIILLNQQSQAITEYTIAFDEKQDIIGVTKTD